MTRQLDLIDDNLRADPQANRLFLDTLCSRKDPERALRLMNEAGVMGRFLPEFGRVVALMQFNMYHHYTVDEHLLVAVGNVSRIERGELKAELPLVSDLIKRVKSREVLFVSMLLHDMAKGLPGDHSDLGAALAESICPRLGLSPADTATVSWLVRQHLTMSDAAQKRDVSDPKTVQNFVEAVQTPERLRLLLILTVADIRAVGPGVWNGWKAQLLRELYLEAETLMSGGDLVARTRNARIADAKGKLETRLKNWPEAARRHAATRHYDAYWLAFDADELEFHARLVESAEQKGEKLAIGARSDPSNTVTEIVIYTQDHPGLFSRLAGAISISNGTIVGAKIFTTTDGYALDVFRVQDASRRSVRRRRTHRALEADHRQDAGGRNPAARGLCQAHAGAARGGVQDPLAGDFRQRGLDGLDRDRGREPGPGRACSTRSPARCSTWGSRFPRPSSRPMASSPWTSSTSATSSATRCSHPDRLAAIEARLMKALEG